MDKAQVITVAEFLKEMAEGDKIFSCDSMNGFVRDIIDNPSSITFEVHLPAIGTARTEISKSNSFFRIEGEGFSRLIAVSPGSETIVVIPQSSGDY